MADLTLPDGREFAFDMNAISIREFRTLFAKDQPAGDGDALLARACGLTLEEVETLGYEDYRRLTAAFFTAAQRPLDLDQEKN